MKMTMKINPLATAMICTLAVPAVNAFGQTTGVSHPSEVVVTTSSQDDAPVLKTRTTIAAPARVTIETKPSAATAMAAPETAKVDSARGASTPEVYGPFISLVPMTPRADVDANVVTEIAGPANQLPIGTLVKTRMGQDLSTLATVEGTIFTAALTEAVERNGRVLLPAGSLLSGRVTDVHGGRRISGAASIHLQPTTVTLPDGTKYSLHAQVIDTNLLQAVKVDREGTIVRRDHPKEALAVLSLTAGSGAAAGGIIGGVPGALIGAAAGAGVSTALWLKQDRQTNVPVNAQVVFALTSPMVVGGQ